MIPHYIIDDSDIVKSEILSMIGLVFCGLHNSSSRKFINVDSEKISCIITHES